MWQTSGKELEAGPPYPELPGALVPFASLDPVACLVFVSAGGLTGRAVVGPEGAAESAWVDPARARGTLDQLRAGGWAREPTDAERLPQPRTDQLRELANPAGVKAAKKVDLIDRMVATIPEAELLGWLESANARWADPVAVTLLGRDDTSTAWWSALSGLVAHSLWSEGTLRHARGSQALLTDDCPVCAGKVPSFPRPKRPPFHLGCRCDVG